jgi:hypothetical protein
MAPVACGCGVARCRAPCVATVVGTVLVFNLGPLLKERRRCMRHARTGASA